MGWKLRKTKNDWLILRQNLSKHWRYTKALFAEVFILNGPRYKNPLEWPHLFVDICNNICGLIAVTLKAISEFFARTYTAGHFLAVGIVTAALIAIYRAVI